MSACDWRFGIETRTSKLSLLKVAIVKFRRARLKERLRRLFQK
jgi:hypothetical protein